MDSPQQRGTAAAQTGRLGEVASRLHHALDVTLGEDQSRVRARNAVFVLSLFRRVVVSCVQVWVDAWRARQPESRATTRRFQKRFAHHAGGPARSRR